MEDNSGTYLKPADVSPFYAQKVLDFLNAVETAQEIADAVEIPDEPDVGLRVAQRILDRRAELGGFTNLHQVADVSYVGPERFTEIVTSLTGQRSQGVPADSSMLWQELQTLRQTVESLQSALGNIHRVTLRPVQLKPFLGQPVPIVVTVSEAWGFKPRPDIPVTLVATWGKLRSTYGSTLQQSPTVTARTNLDGTIKVTLLPPTGEDLEDLQQAALVAMLGSLDQEATRPLDTSAGLEQMVRQYRWEVNFPFRRAVDIYLRDFQPGLVDLVNYQDYMQTWSYVNATVIAYVQEDERAEGLNGSVQGMAALNVQFKNWLGPWFQIYLQLAESENELQNEFQRIKEQGGQAGELVEGISRQAREFVDRQRGRMGKYVGQKVAESELRGFLVAGMDDLPLATRVGLFPTLQVASNTFATAGVNVVTAMAQTHTEARHELNERIGQLGIDDIGNLTERLEGVDDSLGDIAASVDTKANQTAVEQLLQGKLDAGEFAQFQTQLDGLLNGKVNQSTFDSLSHDVVDIATQLGAKLDAATFDQFETQVNSSLGAKVDQSSFNTLSSEVENVSTQLATKVDAPQFGESPNVMGRLLTLLDENFTEVDPRFSELRPQLRPPSEVIR